jgi:hypothetical protein
MGVAVTFQSLNVIYMQTCGRKVEISENTIWIELMTSSTLFKLRRGVCSVFTGGTDFTFDDAAMGG